MELRKAPNLAMLYDLVKVFFELFGFLISYFSLSLRKINHVSSRKKLNVLPNLMLLEVDQNICYTHYSKKLRGRSCSCVQTQTNKSMTGIRCNGKAHLPAASSCVRLLGKYQNSHFASAQNLNMIIPTLKQILIFELVFLFSLK